MQKYWRPGPNHHHEETKQEMRTTRKSCFGKEAIETQKKTNDTSRSTEHQKEKISFPPFWYISIDGYYDYINLWDWLRGERGSAWADLQHHRMWCSIECWLIWPRRTGWCRNIRIRYPKKERKKNNSFLRMSKYQERRIYISAFFGSCSPEVIIIIPKSILSDVDICIRYYEPLLERNFSKLISSTLTGGGVPRVPAGESNRGWVLKRFSNSIEQQYYQVPLKGPVTIVVVWVRRLTWQKSRRRCGINWYCHMLMLICW